MFQLLPRPDGKVAIVYTDEFGPPLASPDLGPEEKPAEIMKFLVGHNRDQIKNQFEILKRKR